MAQRIIGLDVGAWAVKAVVLESSLRRSVCVGFHEHHIPVDSAGNPIEGEVVASILATLRGLERDAVVAAVPGKDVLMRELALPFADDKRVQAILGFQLESVLPRPLEEVVYDYQVLREAEDGATLLCSAIDRANIGALGALMSSLHLYFIRPLQVIISPTRAPEPVPASAKTASPRHNWRSAIRADVWKTPFGAILAVMLFFTLAQNLAMPLFPIYFVRDLGLTDTQLGIGTAIFYFAHLIGSTQMARLAHKIGNHRLTAYGSMALCIYPIVLGVSNHTFVYFLLQIIGGAVWAMLGGAQANYLLENIPNDRPAYLAWYSVVANASILSASLAGPVLSNWMGIQPALIVFGILRLLGGWGILKWGHGNLQVKT